MKKIILVLAVSITALTAFASDNTVDPRVLESFKTEFTNAKEVSWVAGEDYFRAEFTFNEQRVNAYYSPAGELLGITRYITSLDLPMNLQNSLRKSYSDFWISDLFEVTKSESTSYYITLENADTKLVVKATANDEWSVYKKTRKI